MWNGKFFETVTLQSLGLVLQLGHTDGSTCEAPAVGPRNFFVLHTNGVHPTTVTFCECDQARVSGSRTQQLLRTKLFPASLDDPSTCATFQLLETFEIQTLQSKITAYDFYKSLVKLTDRTGTQKPFVRRILY